MEGGGQLLVADRMCLENQGPRKYIAGSLMDVVFRGPLEARWQMAR